MPVLSNSTVTRPQTAAELEAVRFQTPASLTDTRTLRFYYRRLPDNRLQIGSRSAITGADAAGDAHRIVLTDALQRKFPALRDIGIDHYWWGWVDVSHDMMPRVVQPDPRRSVCYALGYGGNGVAFSAHAGRRMAQLVAGGLPAHLRSLPIYDSPLPYPRLLGRLEWRALAPWRRLGQRALYRWYHWRDERR
jgi:glycine/D-amino acid oxidase-like deaminating enzyme